VQALTQLGGRAGARPGRWPLALVLGALLGCGACAGSSKPPVQPVPSRVFTYLSPGEGCHWIEELGYSDIEGSPPMTVSAAVEAIPCEKDRSRDYVDLFTKAEVDFGEDSGWLDGTAQFKAFWFYQGHPESEGYMISYTYTIPGVYNIRGQVTFWDGEVICQTPYYIRVHVLAPTGGAT